MKNSQFNFFLVFLIVGFGVLGYTSYRTIDFNFAASTASADAVSSTESVVPAHDPYAVQVSQTQPIPTAPDIVTVSNGTTTTVSSRTVPVAAVPEATETPKEKELTGERKTLANLLNNLIKDDIRMKIGSSGTRVGTVQKFMNLYENTKITVDNKYGEGLKKRVTAFQSAQGDEVDGLADPGTYQKMIDWLKTN